jgi:hypothetical protein
LTRRAVITILRTIIAFKTALAGIVVFNCIQN